MKIKRFEELECWQEARKLMNMLYSNIGEKLFSKDYRLKDQLIGAGISVMNNIAEGFDSQSNLEFVRFLRYSRRSVSEIENCLYIALDQSYITAQTFEKIFKQTSRNRQITDGLIRYLRIHRAKQA